MSALAERATLPLVSAASVPPASAAPVGVELRLLGGASLQSTDGTPLTGRAAHRHRLALLARLALAAPGGLTRDKLVGLLWPERDEASARHLLRAALHELRSALGAELLAANGNELRLDPRLLLVDVHDFEAGVAQGDLERAVTIYRGPFLDGFHLDDAEAFDEWMTGERARLAAVYELALERMATLADERRDGAAAVRWWRTLASVRPADGRVALRLMEALVSEGDPAGALAHAATHTSWLHTQLGVGPDPSLTRRVTSLRRGMPASAPSADDSLLASTARSSNTATSPVASLPSEASGASEAAALSASASVASPASASVASPVSASAAPAEPLHSPRDRARSTVTTQRRIAWSIGVVATVLLLSVVTLRDRKGLASAPLTGADTRAPSVVAVAPFALVGSVSPDLRDGLATLLTANLDQVAELRLIPAAQVASNVAGSDSAATNVPLLRAVHAEFLVSGTVVPSPEGIAVTTRIVDSTGTVRASIIVRGSPTDLATLVDRISLSFLRELWGRRWGVPEPRLAAVATTSSSALRAYLRGEMFLRAALWDSAASALAEAIDHDSTFALAHMRLAEPYGWRYGMSSAPAQRALAAAARFADRLPPRERMLLTVRRLHEEGALAALDSAAALAERYPDDAEAQYVRADVRFHAMDALGRDMALRAAVAFDTAMALDSASARVFAHPLSLSLVLGDSLRFDRSSSRLDALGGGSHMNVAEHWDYALLRQVRFAPPATAVRVLTERLRRAPPPFWQITDLLPALERTVFGAESPQPELVLGVHDAVRVAYRSQPAQVADIDGIRTTLLIGLGRMNAARSWLGRAWDVYANGAPGSALTPVAFGYAPPGWLDGVSERIATSPYWQSTPAIRRKASYWQGMIALASGDSRGARAAFERAGAPPATGVAGDTVSRGLAAALRAGKGWIRYADGDTVGALREVEAGLREGGYDGEAMLLNRPTRVWFTRMLAETPARRAEAIDRIRGELMRAEGYRLAWWRLELSRALAANGDAVGAAIERKRFDALWAGADASARAAALVEHVGTDRAPSQRRVR